MIKFVALYITKAFGLVHFPVIMLFFREGLLFNLLFIGGQEIRDPVAVEFNHVRFITGDGGTHI